MFAMPTKIGVLIVQMAFLMRVCVYQQTAGQVASNSASRSNDHQQTSAFRASGETEAAMHTF
eukprot:2785029-Pleurochrysis_carterae.AAC.2